LIRGLEQVSVAGWENSHTHNPSYGSSGTGRGEAQDVVVVVAGLEPGGRGTVKEQADGWSGTGG